jgi:hypothetical protein
LANLESEISRGENAKRLLEDEIFQEAFSVVRQRLIDEMMNTPVRDTEGREFLFLAIKSLDQVKNAVVSVIESGAMARIQLDRE